jgi:hypothetical protein
MYNYYEFDIRTPINLICLRISVNMICDIPTTPVYVHIHLDAYKWTITVEEC